jgi:hypothetical protein
MKRGEIVAVLILWARPDKESRSDSRILINVLRGAGDPEFLTDEDMVRAAGAEQMDCVRAIAQLQHSVDGPRVFGERRGLGRFGCRSRNERSRSGTPARRDLAGASFRCLGGRDVAGSGAVRRP